MMSKAKPTLIAIAAAVFLFLSGALILGTAIDTAYADVGSIAAGEDITYDKDGGVLSSMGFDTSKMPDDYDPDATTNPYGSDVSTLDEVKEAVFLDMLHWDQGEKPRSFLYGHNKKLNGSYDEFTSGPIMQELDGRYVGVQSDPREFIGRGSFVDAAKCDITGDGRDSALAIVYTNYNYDNPADPFIYLCLYDPATGRRSDSIVVGEFTSNDSDWRYPRVTYSYLVQSQIQVTVGDYDKDSIDEIAVYSPAKSDSDRNAIKFFDLVDGKECKDPFNIGAWQHSWNYMLPRYSEPVVDVSTGFASELFTANLYNNIDLASGDADNDGIDDLIVSYGASDTNYHEYAIMGSEQVIARSIASKSVLLYGSDDGQMLRDSQPISYGDQDLIRVSFAFGDVDADGNEDMFIAGQFQAEQSENVSRALGRYVYDEDSGDMKLESLQDLKVVNGTWSEPNSEGEVHFYSSNGWDEFYCSAPMMKTNLAIGDILGQDSSTKIYLDSVLYSYENGSYEIVDELEDDSDDGGDGYKGSCLFAGDKAMMGYYGNSDRQSCYYEFGADSGNFTAAPSDYFLMNRVSVDQNSRMGHDFGGVRLEATSSILLSDSKGNLLRKDPIHGESSEYAAQTAEMDYGAPVFAFVADTDKDGLVAEYTGEHNIQYQDPAVLAVLASPPYFKDVAAYDENDMLVYLTTEYGTSSGSSHGHEETYEGTIGIFLNTAHGLQSAHGILNVGGGYARSETWGWSKERTFEMSYSTEGGEDAVVMYSIPSENYVYKVRGVTVDDDGNFEEFTNTMIVTKPHLPVTQTLTLEDYNEIQKRYPDTLPDVTKYLTSTPGDPSTYPKHKKDLSDEALSHIDYDTEHPIDSGEKWAGVSFGTGSITQSLSYSKESRDRYKNHMDGGYGSVEIGFGSDDDGPCWFLSYEFGFAYNFSQMHGPTKATLSGADCSGTIKNMPRDAKGYGYDFSWKLLKYNIEDKGCTFPVVTYIVNDVTAPPVLPDTIEQDFDNTTDSQIALTWTYNHGSPLAFDIYRYKDFPIGGGDELIGTVAGNDFKIMKDEDGNTLRDKDGQIIRGYSFIDEGLTADTKYQYRMKVRTAKLPSESIFSPIIEARTDVSTKPDLSLTTEKLTIYPDGTYNVKVNLADPESYQEDMSYQWQKYDTKLRAWEDVEGCDKQVLHFFNGKNEDAGTYRCRVNLIRKVESHPQYISAFTESCEVGFSLRSVKFSEIQVFEGSGYSKTNTGVSVNLSNTSQVSREKPTGTVTFDISGPNGTFKVSAYVDEATGAATVNSIEDRIEDLGQQAFVDGGYVVTASYGGSAIFYPAKKPEEFHYLRNIDESIFLSLKSMYYFGEDMAATIGLYDYKVAPGGVKRTVLTDKISKIKFYGVAEDGISKIDDVVVAEYDVSENLADVPVPLDKRLARKAYVEAYMNGSDEPAAAHVIQTRKIPIELAVQDKTTGIGDAMELPSAEDVKLSSGESPFESNIVTEAGNKSLADFMLFRYYEQNGDFICDSEHIDENLAEFVPASYYSTVELKEAADKDDAFWFYNPTYKHGRFLLVGSYYLVSAGPQDKSTGQVRMISPDDLTDFSDAGYVGGTKIVLKAEPNPGYKIDKWVVEDCGNTTTYPGTERFTFTVRSQEAAGDGKISIIAQMTPKDNTITIGKIGSGQITSVPEVASGEYVLAGTILAFRATPDAGWHFAEWRLTTLGGSNTVSEGIANEDGSNAKLFTMPDSSAEVYALFARDTIDVAASDGLEVLFTNNGYDPYHDEGETVQTERGRSVPKGVTVTVRAKPGFELTSDAEWAVVVENAQGEVPVEVSDTMSQGKRACMFTLPEDATSCSVSAATVKGQYTVAAETDGVQFTISVDGKERAGSTVKGIASGSQVDIKAKPERGKRLTGWIINGETRKTSDAIYTFNIVENMSIAAITEPVDAYTMKLNAQGGGTLEYTISNAEGDEVDTNVVGEDNVDYTVPVYPDESVFFQRADEGHEYTLTSIYLNGVQQELDGSTFTVGSVDGDIDLLATFSPNIYFSVTMSKDLRDGRSLLLDEGNGEIGDGEILKVAKNRALAFNLVIPNTSAPFVRIDGQDAYLEPESSGAYGDDMTLYHFKTERVTSDMTIVVTDYDTWYISTPEELRGYLDALAAGDSDEMLLGQPNGVLLDDIDMSGESIPTIANMYARFDGDGYTIKNLSIGSDEGRQEDFCGIFGTLHEGAELKDVAFDNVTVYAASNPAGGGLLSQLNYGTISGVSILDSRFDMKLSNSQYLDHELTAGLAYENLGTIEFCMVRNLAINVSISSRYAGSAGVVFNKVEHADVDAAASMVGNYFEYLYKGGYDTEEPALGTAHIVAIDQNHQSGITHRGTFTSNYFLQSYNAQDGNGISAFSLTKNPYDQESAEAEVQTAEFYRKLAYTMNKEIGKNVWGVSGNGDDDTGIYQLSRKSGKCFAPVKVDFVSGKTITRYLAPGKIVLPGEDDFGAATPIAWEIGDEAYPPGAQVDIQGDMRVTGIGEYEEYSSKLLEVAEDETVLTTVYYKDLNDALRDAAQRSDEARLEIHVIGDAALSGTAQNVDDNLKLVVEEGASLTIGKDLQINNKGAIVVEPGATIHKYGSLLNEGSIVIDEASAFNNYGSALVDRGSVSGREFIKCMPHLFGEWTYEDAPDAQGNWTRTCACTVCGQVDEETVAPNPAVQDITGITIAKKPAKVRFEIGDTFADEGLLVVATSADGSKAVVTQYTLALKVGDAEEKAIANGDELRDAGAGKVAVKYGAFSESYDVEVEDHAHIANVIDEARTAAQALPVSEDGKDLPVGAEYVTPAAKQALEDAIAAAQAVADDAGSTFADLEAAVAALNEAKQAFDAAKRTVEIDPETLAEAIEDAQQYADGMNVSEDGKGLSSDTAYVTPAAWKTFVNAIAAAKAVAGNPQASQTAIAAALKALEEARQSFDAAKQTNANDDSSGDGGIEEPIDKAEPGATESQIEKYLEELTDDTDPPGSEYVKLRLKGKKAGKNSVRLNWQKIKGAKKYLVVGNRSGKKYKYKKIALVTKNSFNVPKLAGKKLKKGTYYKFIVVALDGDNKVITTSRVAHVATRGGKFANPLKVKAKAKASIKVGKSKKLNAKQVKPKKGKVKKYLKLRYESTNTKVATVSKAGKIKGVGKGKCTIYVYAQNGIAKKIKVTVTGDSQTNLRTTAADGGSRKLIAGSVG